MRPRIGPLFWVHIIQRARAMWNHAFFVKKKYNTESSRPLGVKRLSWGRFQPFGRSPMRISSLLHQELARPLGVKRPSCKPMTRALVWLLFLLRYLYLSSVPLGVACKNGISKRIVFKRDWIVCLKYNNRLMFNSQHDWGVHMTI
jgi:hypothetical protein